MSQENIQTDTPQEGANEQQYASLEEAVFGNINEGSDSVESALIVFEIVGLGESCCR